ncbi:MAG: methyltransferase domain-containing protein [Leptolyngbya sp. IPPAS B-1204]|nr:MAG: methyltransferase domain-containing protein [Leptolyngbya sp. IPPAS B-1204]
MKFCKLADVADWQDPEFQEIASLLMEGDCNRKAWEFIQVYQGLKHLGLLNGESKAIGLGVGHENLIYAFTNVCGHVVATDLYESQDWSTAAMAVQDIYERNPFPYQRDRLLVQHMDMRQIEFPDQSFDFVWSCCAIEHVNNFYDLHQVYREIHRVLKPGGIAALTTEFNNTDHPRYEPNMLFTDRAWVEAWLTGADSLVQGFELIDQPDFFLSDRPENQPVPRKQTLGAIQVYCGDIVLNSIAFFLRKSGAFSRSYDEQWLPPFWRLYLAACDAYRDYDYVASEALLKQALALEALEPRLKIRALRRLIEALYAQSKVEEVRQICAATLLECANCQDEDQLVSFAIHSWQCGLEAEANQLYAKLETLPSANVDVMIQSRLQQARYYEKQGEWEKALELVGQAEQEILPGAHTEVYKPKIYFRTGSIYEKLGKRSSAIRFYRLALEVSATNSELQLACYRRLTVCLQAELDQERERTAKLEATNRWMQTSKFWKLRSVVVGVKAKLQGRDPSPSL